MTASEAVLEQPPHGDVPCHRHAERDGIRPKRVLAADVTAVPCCKTLVA